MSPVSTLSLYHFLSCPRRANVSTTDNGHGARCTCLFVAPVRIAHSPSPFVVPRRQCRLATVAGVITTLSKQTPAPGGPPSEMRLGIQRLQNQYERDEGCREKREKREIREEWRSIKRMQQRGRETARAENRRIKYDVWHERFYVIKKINERHMFKNIF